MSNKDVRTVLGVSLKVPRSLQVTVLGELESVGWIERLSQNRICLKKKVLEDGE